MGLLDKIYDKFCVKQWAVGLARTDAGTLVNNGIKGLKFTWLPNDSPTRFFADPFIFKNKSGQLEVIYEDFSYYDQYGKISITTVDDQFRPIESKVILDTGSHLSYPNVILQDGKTFIMPEASKGGDLYCYEFDFATRQLKNRHTILSGIGALDATILYHQQKYWLFATHRGPNSNNQLHIYHSANWQGPFKPHQNNPVKNDLDATRPAGNFFTFKGEIYRPTQNSKNYYGKSVSINKIIELNEEVFREETVSVIDPPMASNFNFAIHTINLSGDVIVIDGLRRMFKPFEQLKIFFKSTYKHHD